MVGLWVKLLKIPRAQLYAGILIFCHRWGLWHAPERIRFVPDVRSGLLGVVMRRYDFPTAPVIVGLILEPMAEAQMRSALSIGEGSWRVFIERPKSLTVVIMVVAVLVVPRLPKRRAVA